MKNQLRQASKPVNCLLVEGSHDKHVLWSLLEHYEIPEVFRVEAKEGIDILLNTLDMELERSGLTRLGIVVDTDSDVQSRWEALRHRLIQCGYQTVPLQPSTNGTIILEEDLPVVGIWLMPENTLPGMLEDFLHLLVPDGDKLWLLAEEVVLQVEAQECRFRPTYRSKVKMHTWLAWQEEPGKPFGQAITARYLDADAPYAQKLVTWLRNLFT
jgi:uncharacterized protein DUF3226